MRVRINGQTEDTAAITIAELLSERKLDSARIVAELNGEIIRKEHYSETVLTENDTIELVQFVGGG